MLGQQLPVARPEERGSIWGADDIYPAPADRSPAPARGPAPPEHDQGHSDLTGLCLNGFVLPEKTTDPLAYSLLPKPKPKAKPAAGPQMASPPQHFGTLHHQMKQKLQQYQAP